MCIHGLRFVYETHNLFQKLSVKYSMGTARVPPLAYRDYRSYAARRKRHAFDCFQFLFRKKKSKACFHSLRSRLRIKYILLAWMAWTLLSEVHDSTFYLPFWALHLIQQVFSTKYFRPRQEFHFFTNTMVTLLQKNILWFVSSTHVVLY